MLGSWFSPTFVESGDSGMPLLPRRVVWLGTKRVATGVRGMTTAAQIADMKSHRRNQWQCTFSGSCVLKFVYFLWLAECAVPRSALNVLALLAGVTPRSKDTPA